MRRSPLNRALQLPILGLQNAKNAVDCVRAASSDGAVLRCGATQLGGETKRIADCLDRPALDRAVCLLGNKSEVRTAQRGYVCLATQADPSALVLNCMDGVIDQKSRQTLACVSRAGSDKAKLTGCAATAVLPPNVARA